MAGIGTTQINPSDEQAIRDVLGRSESEDRLSFVLTKREGRWRLAHHNTVIDAAAKPFNPVKSG